MLAASRLRRCRVRRQARRWLALQGVRLCFLKAIVLVFRGVFAVQGKLYSGQWRALVPALQPCRA